jgi:hypothetical protein
MTFAAFAIADGQYTDLLFHDCGTSWFAGTHFVVPIMEIPYELNSKCCWVAMKKVERTPCVAPRGDALALAGLEFPC